MCAHSLIGLFHTDCSKEALHHFDVTGHPSVFGLADTPGGTHLEASGDQPLHAEVPRVAERHRRAGRVLISGMLTTGLHRSAHGPPFSWHKKQLRRMQ